MKAKNLFIFSCFFLLALSTQADSLSIHPGGRAVYSSLNQGFSPWYELGIDLSIAQEEKFKIITSLAGYERFDVRGMSLTADAYFFLSESWYINTTLSAGRATYLPDFTAGFQLYRTIQQVELHIGYRRMAFDPAVNIYSGGIGYYLGNYWIDYTFTMANQTGLDQYAHSHLVRARKYFRTAQQYMEIKGAVGEELGALVNADQVNITPQKVFGIGYFHNIKQRSLGVVVDSIIETIRPDTDRLRISVSVILR